MKIAVTKLLPVPGGPLPIETDLSSIMEMQLRWSSSGA